MLTLDKLMWSFYFNFLAQSIKKFDGVGGLVSHAGFEIFTFYIVMCGIF